jgi:hypothetical protein
MGHNTFLSEESVVFDSITMPVSKPQKVNVTRDPLVMKEMEPCEGYHGSLRTDG